MYRNIQIYDISEDEREQDYHSESDMIDVRDLYTGRDSLPGSKQENSYRLSRRSQIAKESARVERVSEKEDERKSGGWINSIRATKEGGIFASSPLSLPARRVTTSHNNHRISLQVPQTIFKKSKSKSKPLYGDSSVDRRCAIEPSLEEPDTPTPRIVTLSLKNQTTDSARSESQFFNYNPDSLESKLAVLESLEKYTMKMMGSVSQVHRCSIEHILTGVLREKEKVLNLMRWGGGDGIIEENESEYDTGRDAHGIGGKIDMIKMLICSIIPGSTRSSVKTDSENTTEDGLKTLRTQDFTEEYNKVKEEVESRLIKLNQQLEKFSDCYSKMEVRSRKSNKSSDKSNKLDPLLSYHTTDTFHDSSIGTLPSQILSRVFSPLRTPVNSSTPKQSDGKTNFFRKVLKKESNTATKKQTIKNTPQNVLKEVLNANVLRSVNQNLNTSSISKQAISSLQNM